LPIDRKRGQLVLGNQPQDRFAAHYIGCIGANNQAAAGLARERCNRRFKLTISVNKRPRFKIDPSTTR
jgi:hypothetical protein